MKKTIYITVTTILVSLLASYTLKINKEESSKNSEVIKTSKEIEDKNEQFMVTDELEPTIELKDSIEDRKTKRLESAQSVLERVEKHYKEK